MRYAISKQLEGPTGDDTSDITSTKSEDYRCGGRITYKEVPYERNKFMDEKMLPLPGKDERHETKKTIYMEKPSRVDKIIAEPTRLFFRNTDDTKLYTQRYMK